MSRWQRSACSRAHARSQLAFTWLLLVNAVFFPYSLADAQITPDESLGRESSVVTPQQWRDLIEGGAIRDSNLFHSFLEFNIHQGEQVFFANPEGITNIFTRVTGINPSDIFGTLGVDGGANLILINPRGINFGPDATLDLTGSFFASTAQSIIFSDGHNFSAIEPQEVPLLTVNIPLGLQYGSNPGSIIVQGSGHNLSIDPTTSATDFSNRPVGLQVNQRETLALLGGDIILDGGNLTATQGNIELWSVADGQLPIISTQGKLSITAPQGNLNYGDINLSRAASVDVSGNGAGNIHLQGQQIAIADGSVISANTLGDGNEGGITIKAFESLEVIGISADAQFVSSIFADTHPGATGNGGDIQVETNRLLIADGAVIASYIYGSGEAEDIRVTATEIEITGITPNPEAPNLHSGITTVVTSAATGNGGNVTVETQQLSINDGGLINSSTYGLGKPGDIIFKAQDIELRGTGSSGISTGVHAITSPRATANGGNLYLETERLSLSGLAQIVTATAGSGNAGTLQIKAESVEISGFSSGFGRTGLFASALFGTGDGGNIEILTDSLSIADGGTINASNFHSLDLVPPGQGKAGNLDITADSLALDNGIITASSAELGGGNIVLQIQDDLVANQGSQIIAEARNSGNGGSINITSNNLELDGGSVVSTKAEGNGGIAGDLNITTNQFAVTDASQVTVNSPSGQAGNLMVIADNLILDRGMLTAETGRGVGGANINLQISNLLRLGDESLISANATGMASGGNISIETGFLLAEPPQGNQGNDIVANAIAGQGGRVSINTQGIFGIAFQPLNTPLNDITASSQSGTAGIVEIIKPNVEPAASFMALSTDFIDPASPIQQSCSANNATIASKTSKLLITGRSGLPVSPNDSSAFHDLTLVDLGHSLPSQEQELVPESSNQERLTDVQLVPQQIVEAQGWLITNDGTIVLTAQPTTNSIDIPWLRAFNCD